MDTMIFFCALYLCAKAHDCWKELQLIRVAVEDIADSEVVDDGR